MAINESEHILVQPKIPCHVVQKFKSILLLFLNGWQRTWTYFPKWLSNAMMIFAIIGLCICKGHATDKANDGFWSPIICHEQLNVCSTLQGVDASNITFNNCLNLLFNHLISNFLHYILSALLQLHLHSQLFFLHLHSWLHLASVYWAKATGRWD